MMVKNFRCSWLSGCLAVLLVVTGALVITSCSDDENSVPETLLVKVEGEGKKFQAAGGQYFLKLETNGTWQVEIPAADAGWCSVNKMTGEGNIVLLMTLVPNTGAERSTTVTVVVGDIRSTLQVVQRAVDDDSSDDVHEPGEVIPGRLELPALKGGKDNLFITHYTNYKGQVICNYSMEYDCTKKHTRWVAFTFYNETAANNVSRTDAWADDPQVPAQYRSVRSDFSGYDRGHLVASADRLFSREANEQTFYYSNMSPQIGRDFNQTIWANLENRVQSWGAEEQIRDTLYIVKGGTIDGDNLWKFTGNQLAVPKYYFMALLLRKNDTFRAIAFCLEHKAYSGSYNFKDFAMSIDDLEKKTGIDFFPNLPDDVEPQVEAVYDTNKWPGL